MTKPLIDEIKAAQAAPADDYIVLPEAESQSETDDAVLHTARLPQSIGPDAILPRLDTQPKKTLVENGLAAEEVACAKLHIRALPNAKKVQATIDQFKSCRAIRVIARSGRNRPEHEFEQPDGRAP